MDNGRSIIDMLYAALPYEQRFEGLVWEFFEQQNNKPLLLKRIEELKKPMPGSIIAVWIAAAVLGFYFFMQGLVVSFEAQRAGVLVWAVTLPIIILVALLITYNIKKSRKEEFFERIKRYNEIEKDIPILMENINSVMNEAIELGYDFIPLDYFSTEAIQFFINAFEKYLARDMHEAALLYEQAIMRNEDLQRQEERHRELMQEMTWLDIHVLMTAREISKFNS